MARVDRLGASHFNEPSAARSSVSAASAISCLYRHWRTAGLELERLARELTRKRFEEALGALERACISVRIAGDLVGVIERVPCEHSGFTQARDLRMALVAEVIPWLEEARRELPAAASVLCSAAADEAAREAVYAAMRQLDGAPAPSQQKTGS